MERQRQLLCSRSAGRDSSEPHDAGLKRERAEFPPAERPVNSTRQIDMPFRLIYTVVPECDLTLSRFHN